MSLLSMMEATLPPGFKFHPRDEELICDYLARKIAGDSDYLVMIDVDLNKCEPWDLPEMACVGGKEWYFFSLRDRKYTTGLRTNRATLSGYWKATGKDRVVSRNGVIVGTRKTLVFYQGRAPKGRKTDWVMHEFRMEGSCDLPKFSLKEDWALCRVFFKSRVASYKPSPETCYDNTTYTCFAFNETPHGFEGYEEVPRFTNSSHRPNHQVTETSPSARISAHFAGFPDLSSDFGSNQFVPFDQKVLNPVLNQLTMLDGSQKREADLPLAEGSIASCLTEACQSSMWNIF